MDPRAKEKSSARDLTFLQRGVRAAAAVARPISYPEGWLITQVGPLPPFQPCFGLLTPMSFQASSASLPNPLSAPMPATYLTPAEG